MKAWKGLAGLAVLLSAVLLGVLMVPLDCSASDQGSVQSKAMVDCLEQSNAGEAACAGAAVQRTWFVARSHERVSGSRVAGFARNRIKVLRGRTANAGAAVARITSPVRRLSGRSGCD